MRAGLHCDSLSQVFIHRGKHSACAVLPTDDKDARLRTAKHCGYAMVTAQGKGRAKCGPSSTARRAGREALDRSRIRY
jgi:hypothetical protein